MREGSLLNISIFVFTTVYVLQKNIKNITEIWIKTYFAKFWSIVIQANK